MIPQGENKEVRAQKAQAADNAAGAQRVVPAGHSSKRVNGVVGVLVVLLVAGAFAFVLFGQPQVSGRLNAVVHDGDGGTRELPLAQDAEVVIATSLGENVVVVQGGAVYVREADCSNQDCVRQGRIDTPGQQVICLPHKLWIEIVAAGEEGGEMDERAVPGSLRGIDVASR